MTGDTADDRLGGLILAFMANPSSDGYVRTLLAWRELGRHKAGSTARPYVAALDRVMRSERCRIAVDRAIDEAQKKNLQWKCMRVALGPKRFAERLVIAQQKAQKKLRQQRRAAE